MKKRVDAITIYKELNNKFDIKNQIGSIEIKLGGFKAKYNGKDAIGNLLQEWLKEWLLRNNYYFRIKNNTQEFPDFLLSENDNSNMLEIKTFNADASPAFDIANFDSYCTSLLVKPERLDADYLILSYSMEKSELKINNIWLKKVWELTSRSGPNPIKLQTKRGQIYNIRPCTWYSKKLKYKPFKTREEFVTAISETHVKYPQCDGYKKDWLTNIRKKYRQSRGTKL